VHVDVATGEPTPAFALAALLDFPVKVRHVDARPATIEVRDAGVRDHLAEALDGTGTLVRPVDRLPAAEEGVANFEAASAARPRVPGLLEATGMTVARVRPFADAAAAFYAARLWRHLVNEDLIVVDAPRRRPARGPLGRFVATAGSRRADVDGEAAARPRGRHRRRAGRRRVGASFEESLRRIDRDGQTHAPRKGLTARTTALNLGRTTRSPCTPCEISTV
jgi:hypothetical protein